MNPRLPLIPEKSIDREIKNLLKLKILGRKLHTIGCALHQNELPLRALFKKLIGTTTGPRSFNGPLGQRCLEDIHGEPQVQFEYVVIRVCSQHHNFYIVGCYRNPDCDDSIYD